MAAEPPSPGPARQTRFPTGERRLVASQSVIVTQPSLNPPPTQRRRMLRKAMRGATQPAESTHCAGEHLRHPQMLLDRR